MCACSRWKKHKWQWRAFIAFWVAISQRFRPEDDADTDGVERETASHAAHVLRRQPATGRPDEGAARRDDRTESASHPRLVSEQALQGQETVDTDETAAASAATAAATTTSTGQSKLNRSPALCALPQNARFCK